LKYQGLIVDLALFPAISGAAYGPFRDGESGSMMRQDLSWHEFD